MDYETKDIDFERVEMLLSVVKDCAGVGPQLTAIGAAAMHELVDMNRDLAERQADAGKAKLRAEQEKAAEINASTKPSEPIVVKPGQPVPPQVTEDEPSIYPSNQDETSETNDVRRI